MAKIYSEKSLLNRQRLSSKASDEELAVIENGYSRSGLNSQTSVLWHTAIPFLYLCSRLTEVICFNMHACHSCPCCPQGSVSLRGHLREKSVFRIQHDLIYRGRGYGQVNLQDAEKDYFMQPFWYLILTGQMILGNKNVIWLFTSRP